MYGGIVYLDAMHDTKEVHNPWQVKNGGEQLKTPFKQYDDPVKYE